MKKVIQARELTHETYLPISKSLDVDAISAQSQRLKILNESLRGSSVLYVLLFNNQRQRVLAECGGVGVRPWNSKKVCLVLLSAVGIETMQIARPALLGDVGSRAAVLLSLDGITRVMSVEGLSSQTLPFFLNSLDLIGLSNEKDGISKILYDSRRSEREILGSLRRLRKSVERRLRVIQSDLDYPRELRLSVPGPLESGI